MKFERKPASDEPKPAASATPSLEHIPLGPSSLPQNAPPPISPAKGSRRLVSWLIILSILWVILLIAGSILLLQNRDKQKKLDDVQSVSLAFRQR